MKQQIQIVAMIAIAFTSLASRAEAPVTKAALRVDFNKMIEDNNNQRKNLHENIDERAEAHANQPQAAITKQDDKGKVIDFIDVEVGVGQAPALVDRRYDSVGEPKLADPSEFLIKN